MVWALRCTRYIWTCVGPAPPPISNFSFTNSLRAIGMSLTKIKTFRTRVFPEKKNTKCMGEASATFCQSRFIEIKKNFNFFFFNPIFSTSLLIYLHDHISNSYYTYYYTSQM